MWQKWVFIATVGALTCLMRGTVGDIVAVPGGRDLGPVVAISRATRHAPPDQPLGVPPPPLLWGHAYCRWHCRGRRGRRVPLVRVYGWAAFFLVLGALNLAGGCWYLTIGRSASART